MDTPRGEATEAFARRLDELRSGSGRTYGALARRVGVGASTLHRYCSGRTVPVEFAPIERLARLCGCEGDDLVDLHRLWVLADAERRGRQKNAARAAAADTPSAALVIASPRAVPVPASPAPPRPPLRSRRATLLIAFAAAVAALALLAGFRELASATGDQGPAVKTGPGRTGDVPQTSGTPFAWTADDHVWRNSCDHSYLLGHEPSAVPSPPAQADAESWAASLGARHGGETQVRITLQGRDADAVVLESLQVRVVARRTPQQQGVYRMSSGCGGALTPRLFDVDLDRPRPVARSLPGNDSGEPIPAVSFPYRISASDPEVLLVSGRTVSCDCDWYLEVRWSSGERGGTVRIDDGGRPFRTSAVRGGPVYDYDDEARRWAPAASDGPRGG